MLFQSFVSFYSKPMQTLCQNVAHQKHLLDAVFKGSFWGKRFEVKFPVQHADHFVGARDLSCSLQGPGDDFVKDPLHGSMVAALDFSF